VRFPVTFSPSGKSSAINPFIGINGVEVVAYQEIRPGGRSFAIPENQNNPRDHEQFFKGLEQVTA
jgi:hypothetical protein